MAVLLIGTLDTKGVEFAFVRDLLRAGRRGRSGAGRRRTAVAGLSARHYTRTSLRGGRRGPRRPAPGRRPRPGRRGGGAGAARIALDLHRQGRIDGVLGLGGSAGAAVGTAAMRALPFGVPKLMVSTMASGQVRPYVGQSDVCMMYPVVDISGLNRISRRCWPTRRRRSSAWCGGAETPAAGGEDRPLIAATMFGVTTPCVDAARARWRRPAMRCWSFTPPARAAGRWRRSSPRGKSPASST